MIVPRNCGTQLAIAAMSLVHALKRDHQIAVAGDIKRRHRHLGAGERRQKLPVAIDVAVPVEAAAKAAAREFAGVKIHVRFAEPWRQHGRLGHPAEKTAVARDHTDGAGRFRTMEASPDEAARRGTSPEPENSVLRTVCAESRSSSASATPGFWK